MEHSDEQKTKASEHIYYELDMLLGLAKRLKSGEFQGKEDRFIKNAILESFLIHLRGLYYFFYSIRKPDSKRDEDDVLAIDYCGSWKPRDSMTLKDALTPLNKQLAHLTYSRLSEYEPNYEWRCEELANEMRRLMNDFVEHARPELIADTFRVLLEAPLPVADPEKRNMYTTTCGKDRPTVVDL